MAKFWVSSSNRMAHRTHSLLGLVGALIWLAACGLPAGLIQPTTRSVYNAASTPSNRSIQSIATPTTAPGKATPYLAPPYPFEITPSTLPPLETSAPSLLTATTYILQKSASLTITVPPNTDPPTKTAVPLPTQPVWDCLVNKETIQARVTRINDGDTIEVEIGDGVYRVRYIGINAPANQDASGIGEQATAQNKAWVENQTVILVRDTSKTDRYNRLLRYVLVETANGVIFINLELVRNGLAQVAPYPPDTACQDLFESAQEQARAQLAGIWSSLALTATAFQAPEINLAQATPTQSTNRSGTANTGSDCNCTGPDKDCGDFATRAEAQACYAHCVAEGYGDIFRLDGDNDGKVCETKP